MSKRVGNTTFIQYGMLTPDQWLKLAVCEVKLPLTSDNTRDTPSDGRMGVLENGKQCETCGQRNIDCPGHYGYILLDEPVFNKLFLSYTLKILQCICPYCSGPRMDPDQARIQSLTVKTGRKRFLALVKILADITRCPYGCDRAIPSYCIDKDEIKEFAPSKNQKVTESKRSGIPCKASEVYNIFRRISHDTLIFLGLNSGLADNRLFTEVAEGQHVHEFRPEALIYIVFPVIPPCSRPHAIINGEQREDHLTDMYNGIIKINNRLKDSRDGKPRRRRGGKVNEQYDRTADVTELELRIASFVDNRKKCSKLTSGGGRSHKSIVERLTKKGGRIQGNIMSVRSNFTARSVIGGGGTMIPAGYLGVPKQVCRNLTEREVVQDWNLAYLQHLVAEGEVPSVFRAMKGELSEINLNVIQHRGKFVLRKGDIVERYLQKGDSYVPFNRQPTLRIESMRSFKVFPTDELIFRFSLFETSPFNADQVGRQQAAASLRTNSVTA